MHITAIRLDFSPIAEARASRHVSRRQLALGLKVNYSSLWRWENGKAIPSAEHLILIARGLGVPMHHLFRVIELEPDR